MIKYIFILTLLYTQINADNFHNINGHFGEKAPGLSGAYTAISDDPSGAYYNPAGLAFAYDNSISLSASNITRSKKDYVNVLGPGQNYLRESQTYIPNFFGLVKEYKKYKIGFSIVNTLNETFDRNDQVINPIFYPKARSFRTYNLESYNQVQTGMSLARSITSKLSIGATLYYTFDTANLRNSFLIQFADKSYSTATQSENRTTRGVLPILGIMYMPTEKVSLGLSIRHQFVTSGNRLTNSYGMNSSTNSDDILFFESTNKAGGGTVGPSPIISSPLNGKIPETTEVRTGIAIFPTKRFMTSFDIIQTSGFKKKQTQNDYFLSGGSNNFFVINDTDVQELRRYATTNFALGLEYYLNDNFAVRIGGFTNNANSKNVSWLRSAVEAANRDSNLFDASVRTREGVIQYKPGFLREPTRNEHVDLIGGSIGFSWSTSKASLGITLVKEYGRGAAQVDANRPIQQLVYDSTAIYVIVSSKSN